MPDDVRSVVFAPAAAKALRRIDAVDAKRIVAKIDQYAANPGSLANQVKALQGSEFKRLRVGDYRVVFTETMIVVSVAKVGNRREIYR